MENIKDSPTSTSIRQPLLNAAPDCRAVEEAAAVNPSLSSFRTRARGAMLLGTALALTVALAGAAAAFDHHRELVPFLPNPVQTISTIPGNGDVNPYGVAFVPDGFPGGGKASPGDILVSNFNNSMNLQGTGTTIVTVPAAGALALFFQGKPGLGLTTALQVLKEGIVTVGNLPTADGTCATAQKGSILVLDKSGNLLSTITDPVLVNGPWDSTALDTGEGFVKLFVSNVLSGTVVRFDLMVNSGGATILSAHQIASGYSHRCDPAALVVGPTGLVFDSRHDILYVASTEDNEIFALHGAGRTTHDLGRGVVVYQDAKHLHGPLGMAQASNGDFLVSNSDVINPDPAQPSEIVEFTRNGEFVKQLSMDPGQGGSFGLAVATSDDTARFAAVDDNASNLLIWTLDADFDGPH